MNRHNAKVWDVDGGAGATADGTMVHLWTYVGGANQQWRPTSTTGGRYRFTARHSGMCLTVGSSTGPTGPALAAAVQRRGDAVVPARPGGLSTGRLSTGRLSPVG